jgi:ubiquinone/menaquinone biosynthesis C-methylase UbiE
MRWIALGALMAISHGTHAQHHGHGKHGNPEDLDGYLARKEGPERAAWQKPDEVVAALGLKKGGTACDIGAGPGYFALRMARVVGEAGQVFAVDVEPRMLEALRERIAAAGARNVTPVLGLPDDPLLPRRTCDVILIVNTFHHFPDGEAYLKGLIGRLKPGGRIVNIDFHKRELPVGPPVEHKVAQEDFVALAAKAGLKVIGEPAFLPHQYFVVMKARR